MVRYRLWRGDEGDTYACQLAMERSSRRISSSCNVLSLIHRLHLFPFVLQWMLIFRGNSLPPPYSGPEVTVLKSTITSTDTIVELKCSNCTVWRTGKLDISSTAANFIYAYSTTAPQQLSNPNSPFQQHNDHGDFKLNLQSATTTTAPTGAPALTGSTNPKGGLSQRQIVIP